MSKTAARISAVATTKTAKAAHGVGIADITVTGRAFKAADRAARAAHGVGIADLSLDEAAALLAAQTGAIVPSIADLFAELGVTTTAELTVRVESLWQMLTGAAPMVVRWRR
ncbi:hypothetical protein [Nocardia paucivorans]|uniref:hypothetical protein n=1 Tax=Nocardia paucivorans TaxID=114259 RepID=UPI0002D52E15|nr:hypothetical protein [Nocardia paucivorans]